MYNSILLDGVVMHAERWQTREKTFLFVFKHSVLFYFAMPDARLL